MNTCSKNRHSSGGNHSRGRGAPVNRLQPVQRRFGMSFAALALATIAGLAGILVEPSPVSAAERRDVECGLSTGASSAEARCRVQIDHAHVTQAESDVENINYEIERLRDVVRRERSATWFVASAARSSGAEEGQPRRL